MPGYPDWQPPGPLQKAAGGPTVGYPDWEPLGVVNAPSAGLSGKYSNIPAGEKLTVEVRGPGGKEAKYTVPNNTKGAYLNCNAIVGGGGGIGAKGEVRILVEGVQVYELGYEEDAGSVGEQRVTDWAAVFVPAGQEATLKVEAHLANSIAFVRTETVFLLS